jgi:O-antigen/teichoic acid export membrane protein
LTYEPKHLGKGDRRSVQRILLAGAFWNNLSSLVPLVISIVVTPYLVHGFGVEGWGLLALVNSIRVFFGPLGGGLGGTMGRYFALYAGRDDRVKTTEALVTVSGLLLALGGVVTLVSWWTAPLLMGVFGVHGRLQPDGVFLLRTVGILVAVSFLHNLFNAVVNARQLYAFTNTLTIATFAAGSLGSVLCVHTGAGLRGVALVYVGQQVVASAVTVPKALRYMTRRGLRFLPKAEIREIAHFSASVQLMGVISLVNNEVGSLLVGGFFHLRAMAYYNGGSTVSSGVRNLTYNLLGPFGTHLTHRFARGGQEGTVETFERLQRAWVVVTTGISAVGIGASYFAVVEWLGPQFRVGGEVAAVALGGDLVNLWTGVLTQYLAAVGRPDIEARYASFAMVLNIAATAGLVFFGPVGVAGGGAIAAVVASFYLLRVTRRRYSAEVASFLKDVPVIQAIVALVATVVLEAAVQPYAPSGALGLLFSGLAALAGVAVYAVAILGRRLGPFVRVLAQPHFQLAKLADLAFFP